MEGGPRPPNHTRTHMLKLTAITLMLLDHLGWVYGNQPIMRILGRACLPIFVYLSVCGYQRTSNVLLYCKRMLFFALLAQIPYIIFWQSIQYFNVLFLLFCLILFLWLLDNHPLKAVLYLLVVAVLAESMQLFAYSFVYVIVLGIAFQFFALPVVTVILIGLTLICYPWPHIQIFAVLAIPFIYLIADNQVVKSNFFYWFYPVHFVVLVFAKHLSI